MIAANIESLLRTIEPYKATVVAVTKTQPVDAVKQAYFSGLTDMGENRVQEAAAKVAALQDLSIRWHLVGHLQSNKVKNAVSLFSLIQSVDSEKLASEINRVSQQIGKVQDVLLQINVAGEISKFGASVDSIDEMAEAIGMMKNIRICGLMTIAPFFSEPELTRPIFYQMRQLFERLQKTMGKIHPFDTLSMGMTHDYEVALQEGSTMIRIGTGIFGERN